MMDDGGDNIAEWWQWGGVLYNSIHSWCS